MGGGGATTEWLPAVPVPGGGVGGVGAGESLSRHRALSVMSSWMEGRGGEGGGGEEWGGAGEGKGEESSV